MARNERSAQKALYAGQARSDLPVGDPRKKRDQGLRRNREPGFGVYRQSVSGAGPENPLQDRFDGSAWEELLSKDRGGERETRRQGAGGQMDGGRMTNDE